MIMTKITKMKYNFLTDVKKQFDNRENVLLHVDYDGLILKHTL